MKQPLWVLKTAKEKHQQRLVHLSADLARNVGTILDTVQNSIPGEVCSCSYHLNVFCCSVVWSTKKQCLKSCTRVPRHFYLLMQGILRFKPHCKP